MKKYINTFVIAGLIIVGLVLVSRNQASVGGKSTGQPGTLVAQQQQYDFGKISMAAGKVSHNYSLENTSSQKVTVRKIFTSCMCTVASLLRGERRTGPFGMPGHGTVPTINEDLAPGEKTEVEVVFDPAAHGPAGIGRVQRTVTVETSEGSSLQFSFTAEVTP